MAEQKWLQEPIVCDGGHLKDANGNFVVNPDCTMQQSTGDRVAACVNACAGVPTETLVNIAKYYTTCIFQGDGEWYCFKWKEDTDGHSDKIKD